MNTKTILDTLSKYNQTHVIRYIDLLSEQEVNNLLKQINEIDWTFINYLSTKHDNDSSIIEPIDVLSISDINTSKEQYMSIGTSAIKSGKLALLLLAGGQGTRLGFNMPKGAFNIGISKEIFIFQLLIEHTLEVVKLTDTWIHLYIMTSAINYNDTVSFFKAHDYFGYESEYLHFFVQEHNPATDFSGRILMNSKSSIALSPNGNGGWLVSLRKSGMLSDITSAGIEWLNVFAVDNVLQNIADPVFLGATIKNQKASGAKVLKKNSPYEKVGTICYKNKHPYIVEYYELSDEMSVQKKSDGSLAYGYGVILNYLFSIKELLKTLNNDVPLHITKKIVPYIDDFGNLVSPNEPNAYKYESLALDLIYQMSDCLSYEVEREKEFAPIKNKSGIDSVDTARELLKKNNYIL